MTRVKTLMRIGAAVVVAPAALVLAAGPALAAEPVAVSNTETVQARLNAGGSLQEARVYEQLALQGKGSVSISDPVSTENLRNLDGFGGFEVEDGNLVATYSVDGQRRVRTVADHTKSLPLKVAVTYRLDGKTVSPGDVVGRSGTLEARYKVENVTGKDQDVTFDDGTGKRVTRTQKVVIPMVGQLSTVLPSNFTDVRSDEASMAGDGRGGTKMSFTMTLFGPIGSPTAEFGYTAEISDGVIPAADISALPVSPLDSPSFKGGAQSYKGGADTGLQLASGATQIDENVLKLRDGAAELVAGLIKLRDGAEKLKKGLADEAAPGAGKLAGGAGELAAGTTELAAGAGDAKAGSAKLATGAKALSEGVDELTAGVDALPQTLAKDPDFLLLKGALKSIQNGIGNSGDTSATTLLGGLNLLRYGLRNPGGMAACAADPAACGAADGVELISMKLAAAGPDLAQLVGAAKGAYAASGCPADPDAEIAGVQDPAVSTAGLTLDCVYTANVVYGLGRPTGGLKDQTAFAAGTLSDIADGLDGEFKNGLIAIGKGLSNSPCDPAQTKPGQVDSCGIKQAAALISGGVDELVDAISESLVDVMAQAGAGAFQVAAGAGRLDSGLAALQSGAEQLDGGAGQLASGAKQLSSGLTDAASGSGQLADGLGEAAGGAPALEDGASRLSAEGTTKLVDAGKSTASDYGLKYALIEAGAERAKTEGMAYGAPAGAAGATAYSFELAAMTGEGDRNLGRGAAALALFAVGAGVAMLRRRWS